MPHPIIAEAPRRTSLKALGHIGVNTDIHPDIRASAEKRASLEGTSLAQVLREALTHLYNIGWFEQGDAAE